MNANTAANSNYRNENKTSLTEQTTAENSNNRNKFK